MKLKPRLEIILNEKVGYVLKRKQTFYRESEFISWWVFSRERKWTVLEREKETF